MHVMLYALILAFVVVVILILMSALIVLVLFSFLFVCILSSGFFDVDNVQRRELVIFTGYSAM